MRTSLPRRKPKQRRPLTTNSQFFQVQFHQVLKISAQILFREIGKKFRLGAPVDFANALYQLSFTHTQTSFKTNPKHKTKKHSRIPEQNLLKPKLKLSLWTLRFKFSATISTYDNIDRVNVFSLADQPRFGTTPYNLNRYMAEPTLLRPQHIAPPNGLFFTTPLNVQ